jgi:steroid delta-isomerase-like uncharacterized protein
MSTEQNKELVRRMYAALDGHDLGAVESIFAADWVNIDPALPPLRGHGGARQLIGMFAEAFPDFSTTIETLVAEGDLVAVRCTHEATHQGSFMGIPATGRHARVSSSGVYRVAGGRLAENRVVFDAMGLLQQLGIIPAPEVAA